MAVVQKAILNTTGPLCSLHDTLSSGNQVPAEGIKCIVEKTWCLLGSANHQLSVLRRKKVLTNINKEKIILADQPLPNAKRFLFGEDFPSVVSKQAERSRGLGKNLSNAQKPKQSFQKSGITKDRQRPKTTGNFSKYQINQPKKLSVLSPQQGLLKPRLNNYLERWKEITSDPEILHVVSGCQIPFHSVPVQLHFPVPKCSDLTVPLVYAEVNKLLSIGNTLFKKKFLQQTVPRPKKGGKLPSSDRPQPAQQVCRELPFSNGEHFLSEDTSKKGRLYDMHRPKGCISLCPRTQVLTKVPVFPVEKHLLCLPRPAIWAKYCSQGIYKANKTHSSLLAEKRYSNNRIPGRLPNPELLHKRVESKHSTNTRSSAVARFHHKLGEVHASSYSLIDISGPLHRFADNVAQSPWEKDPKHTEQSLSVSLIRNPTLSARKVASLIATLEAARPAIWQAPLH